MGRPSGYKPEFAGQASKLCALGATDKEVADFFEVHIATLYRWQHDFPELCDALKVGKEVADERVQKSLYNRAVGYSFDAKKILQYKGEPVVVPYVEHVPPDVVACIFWLKNRRPAEWREKIDLTNSDGSFAEALAAARMRVKEQPESTVN